MDDALRSCETLSTMANATNRLAVYHEHPDWFRPLFTELERRGVPYVKLDAGVHSYDPSEKRPGYDLVFNRASPSSYLRGNLGTIFSTWSWLSHLDRIGVPVVNGSRIYSHEISKARQLNALEELGVQYPRARVINSAKAAVPATSGLRFPIVVKANVGGSGAGITRFDTEAALAEAVSSGSLNLGIDGTALVQELAPLRGGHIVRVEVLGQKFLYGIRVFPEPGSFDLCPADACQTTTGVELIRGACAVDAPKRGLRVESYTPPANVIATVERIASHVQLDVGGIEYLVDDRDGTVRYYDINALSNFVADGRNVVGFDPFERLVDYLSARLDTPHAARSAIAAA
jgi:glutathione synthase/RimK-type ligase-like ATP-grasp enzyme